ncbi:hypothetical protein OAL14_00500 [Gammaproteobacteria bacterium]|nr:hypothetical protein [Gammaproteobacteria bacterium]
MKIWVTESKNYSEMALSVYRQLGEVLLRFPSREELINQVIDVDCLVVRLFHSIDREILQAAKQLKYIVSPTTGLDHIDLEAAKESSVEVISLKEEYEFLATIPATAELTWGLLLSVMRKIKPAALNVEKGEWNRDLFFGRNLKGKNLGILGFGRVGKQVSKYAETFECNVGVFDSKKIATNGKRFKIFDHIEELLEWSEILCIHLSLNEDSVGFLNEERLNLMRRGIVLINTSRSAVWDEGALVERFKAGLISGIASDVLAHEHAGISISESPLFQLSRKVENVLVTPHIGGATVESMSDTEEFVAQKLSKTYR